MAEISLILTGSAAGLPAVSIALCETGTGVASIPQAAVNTLLTAREQIVRMMAGAPRMRSEELRAFGRLMRGVLFTDEVQATWAGASATAASSSALTTRILATTSELKAIPWEYVAWPDGRDGPQSMISVVRIVPVPFVAPATVLQKSGGLRILLLSASPLGLDAVPWGEIRDGLVRVFGQVLPKIEILEEQETATSTTFLRIIEAATHVDVGRWIEEDDPHVVHFVGHGTDKGVALINSRAAAARLMAAPAFEAALQKAKSCRLVILSACDTANPKTLAPVDATIGTFAEQLVRNAVPAVIASQMVIEKRTVATFCDGLYRALIKSGSIDLAVAAGRCHVVQELDTPSSAAIEWGVPVLYRRLGAAQLFV